MQNLSTITQQTMSSLEIAELTKKNHSHVIRDIKNMASELYGANPKMDDLESKGIFVKLDYRGYTKSVDLDYSHTQTLITGYSIPIRKAVIDRWQELENTEKSPQLPTNYISALEALVESEKAKQIAIATKAEIGSRREATAMNTAAQAMKKVKRLEIELDKNSEYSSIKRMEIITGDKFNWRLLKHHSNLLAIPAIDIPDQNYETVKSYHAEVWASAYDISINGEVLS